MSTIAEIGETKEAFSVSHSARGETSVTCFLTKGEFVVKWTVKCFESTIAEGVQRARNEALSAMTDLREAVLAAWAA